MARETIKPAVTQLEEISSINDSWLDKKLRFCVGKGSIVNGAFKFDMPQQFDVFDIEDSLYDEFIAKYTHAYTEIDLWEYVDRLRSGATTTAPSPNYDWDIPTQTWLPNAARALATAKTAVETERDNRRFANITVGGITIQADEESVRNLEKKLEHIAAANRLGTPLSQDQLFWRDVDNVDHFWPDAASYAAWIDSVVMALGDRETLIWAKSFLHKDALDALSALLDKVQAVADIEAYDVTVNWV